jgi:hypothetical protein
MKFIIILKENQDLFLLTIPSEQEKQEKRLLQHGEMKICRISNLSVEVAKKNRKSIYLITSFFAIKFKICYTF